jgi:glycosyltransferase involved in cell wall biosynthesis
MDGRESGPTRDVKVLVVLTYFRPHTSGLTIYAERLSRGLAARGHAVTVLTSRFDPGTPRDEIRDGVQIVRVPVAFRVSKGVVMPSFGWVATRLVREHDVVSLHLPQFDAAGVALRGRWFGKPTTLTYHCDLSLPPGRLNRIANRVVDTMNALAGRWAHRVVAYTEDFAAHSPYLRRFAEKVTIIPPPVEAMRPSAQDAAAFRDRHGLDGRAPVIGMAARLAAEKGVEVLLDALPRVLQGRPDAQVWFAGQHEAVLGEEAYARRLAPALARQRPRWRFLGVLDAREMAAFFANLDVLVVPSLNSTESFGLVQVEGMLCGTPAIASALPGVRQPVEQTGMGEVVPVGDAVALADSILRVTSRRQDYVKPHEDIERRFSTARTIDGYEALFDQLLSETRR